MQTTRPAAVSCMPCLRSGVTLPPPRQKTTHVLPSLCTLRKKAGSKRNKVPAKNFQVPVFSRFGAALFSLLGQGRRTRGYFF